MFKVRRVETDLQAKLLNSSTVPNGRHLSRLVGKRMACPDTNIAMSRMTQNDYETKKVEISKLNKDCDETGKAEKEIGNKDFEDDDMDKLFNNDEQTKDIETEKRNQVYDETKKTDMQMGNQNYCETKKDSARQENEFNSKTIKLESIVQTAIKEDMEKTARARSLRV